MGWHDSGILLYHEKEQDTAEALKEARLRSGVSAQIQEWRSKRAGQVKQEGVKPWVAKWWMPDHVVFVDELPITRTMKVMKRELRDMWEWEELGPPSSQ